MERLTLFKFVFIFCIALLTIKTSSALECPEVYGCSCDRKKPDVTFVALMTYECDGKNNSLTEIPRTFSSLTTYLYMNNHFIVNISRGDFLTMTNLRYIVIIFSNVSNIEDRTFQNQSNVEELHMEGNSLSRINSLTFQGLDSLKVLNLANNNIQTIDKNSLAGMPLLKKLQVQSNQLSNLPQGLFEDVERLRELLLWNNPLVCDCDIMWLTDFWSEEFLTTETQCSAPPEREKVELFSLSERDFVCSTIEPKEIQTSSGLIAAFFIGAVIITLSLGCALVLIHKRVKFRSHTTTPRLRSVPGTYTTTVSPEDGNSGYYMSVE